MKIRYLFYFAITTLTLISCQKSNDVSKIPHISLIFFGGTNGSDSDNYKVDTAVLEFSLTDGDGDIGNDPSGSQKDIYILDHRPGYDTGYAGYFFPTIDQSIEDPKKGLQGTGEFFFYPNVLTPRTDSLHFYYADTTYLSFFIVDRAGHHSDTLVTKKIRIVP